MTSAGFDAKFLGTAAGIPVLTESGADDAVESVSPAGRRWIGELLDSTAPTGEVPVVLASVALQARLAADGRSDDLPSVRVPRRSGGWLRLDASLMEDGQRVAVMISTAREPEVADLIAQVYGLTAREREVTRLTMQGLSTREIRWIPLMVPFGALTLLLAAAAALSTA